MSVSKWAAFRLLVGLVAARGSLASAQAPPGTVVVTGVAFDSLRGEPLRGAFVTVAGVSLSTTSDSTGVFHLALSPGAYTVSVLHASFDSLGLSGASTKAVVRDGRDTVHLSIPSFASLWRTACGGGTPPRDTGFVFGTVRDAERQTPLAGATVVVRWIALGIDSSAMKRAQPTVLEQAWGGEARSDSTGGYVLCGVPSDVTLRVLGRKDSLSSGLLELLPRDDHHPRVERRDFLLGSVADSTATKRGVVAGLVRDDGGQPVVGARVVTSGADEVRTGADGRFALANVPIGTREIEILAVGVQPVVAAADITTPDTAFIAVEVRKIHELPAVVVTALTARQRLLAEFEERKALHIGQFMDSIRVSQFRTVRDARVFLGEGCSVYIDGVHYDSRQAATELYLRAPQSIAMIETHAHWDPSMPFLYRDPGAMRCGVLLVWTKSWLP